MRRPRLLCFFQTFNSIRIWTEADRLLELADRFVVAAALQQKPSVVTVGPRALRIERDQRLVHALMLGLVAARLGDRLTMIESLPSIPIGMGVLFGNR